jgi:leucyl-tRNA synthetase
MGKVRGKINVSVDATDDEIKKLALEVENVQKLLEGKDILKMIIVPKKLVSIVAK